MALLSYAVSGLDMVGFGIVAYEGDGISPPIKFAMVDIVSVKTHPAEMRSIFDGKPIHCVPICEYTRPELVRMMYPFSTNSTGYNKISTAFAEEFVVPVNGVSVLFVTVYIETKPVVVVGTTTACHDDPAKPALYVSNVNVITEVVVIEMVCWATVPVEYCNSGSAVVLDDTAIAPPLVIT